VSILLVKRNHGLFLKSLHGLFIALGINSRDRIDSLAAELAHHICRQNTQRMKPSDNIARLQPPEMQTKENPPPNEEISSIVMNFQLNFRQKTNPQEKHQGQMNSFPDCFLSLSPFGILGIPVRALQPPADPRDLSRHRFPSSKDFRLKLYEQTRGAFPHLFYKMHAAHFSEWMHQLDPINICCPGSARLYDLLLELPTFRFKLIPLSRVGANKLEVSHRNLKTKQG
jgi:hypothetical protein